jgi:hypothetical protein
VFDFLCVLLDFLKNEFKNEISLAIKSAAGKVGVTTTSTFDKDVIGNKVSFKWAGSNGFSLDKLEISDGRNFVTETSLTNLYPGLKTEFKSNSAKGKNDLGLIFKHQFATVTADVNLPKFDKINASILGGASGFSAGAAATLDNQELKGLKFVAAYSPCKALFASVRAENNFDLVKVALSHSALAPKVVVGASVDHFMTKSDKNKNIEQIGVSYQCCPDFVVKGKLAREHTDGDATTKFHLSGKKNVSEKKLSVTGSVEMDLGKISCDKLKFGLVTTLG